MTYKPDPWPVTASDQTFRNFWGRTEFVTIGIYQNLFFVKAWSLTSNSFRPNISQFLRENGICHNWNFIRICFFVPFWRNWNLSETVFVRIWICQNLNLSELKFVRIGICQNRNLSELEFVRIGIFQNFKTGQIKSWAYFFSLKLQMILHI